MKIILLTLLLCFSLRLSAQTYFNVGFNNPYQTSTGLNLLFVNDKVGVELGFGIPSASWSDDHPSGNVLGDLDVKYYFTKPLGVYCEAGVMTQYSFDGGEHPQFNFTASSPFFGFGLSYVGKIILYYSLDYSFMDASFFTSWGVGVAF